MKKTSCTFQIPLTYSLESWLAAKTLTIGPRPKVAAALAQARAKGPESPDCDHDRRPASVRPARLCEAETRL